MKICNESKCTGCYTCYNVCPKNCISFESDDYGINFPIINEELCIGCKLCVKRCPANNDSEFNMPMSAYATWSLDEIDRKTSASGGLASVIYNNIICSGGVGYGVCMDEDFNLNFIRVDKKERLKEFKGSKYVQASVNNIFKVVKQDLESGLTVVFIGTPCQVDGLKYYLNREYKSLYTIDLICHGTPPITYLKEHISNIKKVKDIEEVNKVYFREDNEFKLILSNNAQSNKSYDRHGKCDEYIQGFLNALFYRESCYSCKYATNERVSDITIGDFWGLGIEEPFEHPWTGAISLALINTDKGRKLFDICKDDLFIEERKVIEALKGNAQLNYPSKKHKNYDLFRREYKANGFNKAVSKSLVDELKLGQKEYKRMLYRNRLKKIVSVFIKRYR